MIEKKLDTYEYSNDRKRALKEIEQKQIEKYISKQKQKQITDF